MRPPACIHPPDPRTKHRCGPLRDRQHRADYAYPRARFWLVTCHLSDIFSVSFQIPLAYCTRGYRVARSSSPVSPPSSFFARSGMSHHLPPWPLPYTEPLACVTGFLPCECESAFAPSVPDLSGMWFSVACKAATFHPWSAFFLQSQTQHRS